jgi:hypothetical protein
MSSAGWRSDEQSSADQIRSDGSGTRAGRRRGLRAAVVTSAVVTSAVVAAGVVAVAGCASASAVATSALAASTSGSASWHIVKRVPSGSSGGFTEVTAVGKNGGWAFNAGSVPTAWERNGSTWTQVPFPGLSDEVVVAAGGTSATDAWAFTSDFGKSRALHWNGRTWSVQHVFSREIGGAVVISRSDVWVFGELFLPGAELGAWHYDGHTWSRVSSGHGLEGGSALSASDIWAFDGADVAHWNGATWSRTSVASLLPARQQLNDPALTGIYAESRHSVYAIANGNLQDEGGPIVVLHWNGSAWSKVARGQFGFGILQQLSSDGHGGLWLPMPGFDGQKSYLVHYSNGHLTTAALPVAASSIGLDTVSIIPGGTGVLAAGETHARNAPGTDVVAVILQYKA